MLIQGVNTSSDALAGDLMLPNDGSITAFDNYAWDDTIYNEEWDLNVATTLKV